MKNSCANQEETCDVRAGLPGVTVAICTANRPQALSKAICSVVDQRLKPDQLIIIDDGKLDRQVVEQLARMVQDAGIKWCYYLKDSESRGLTISRNIALKLAGARVVQFLDDDATMASNCLEQVARVYACDTNNLVAACDVPIIERQRVRRSRRWVDAAYQLVGFWRIYKRGPDVGRALPKKLRNGVYARPVRFLHGGSISVRRDIMLSLGGFDERLGGYALGEDREISYRLGGRWAIVRVAGTEVIHHSDQLSRPDPKLFGKMAVYNYVYIVSKNLPLAMGDYLVLGFSLVGLMLITAGLAVVGNRGYHLRQLAGMFSGLRSVLKQICQGRPVEYCL